MKSTTAGAPARQRRSSATWALAGLLAFQGLGAIGGGFAFLSDTTGSAAGLDPELLERTPFADFLWPGMLLTLGLGLPALVLLYGVLRRPRLSMLAGLERRSRQHWSWSGSIALGLALMAWIIVQLLLIEISPLQPLMLAVGAALAGLPLTRRVRQDLPGGSAGDHGLALAHRQQPEDAP